MNVLLSINPYWANLIYEKKKIYEMRKRAPLQCNIGDKVFLYETYPVCAVTGYFVYNGYEAFSEIDDFAENCFYQHRIPYHEFIRYYKKSNIGFAWFISKPTKFHSRIKLPIGNVKRAPQSFCYIQY